MNIMPIKNRMNIAGIAAIAHLTMNVIIDPNFMSKSMTTTLRGFCLKSDSFIVVFHSRALFFNSTFGRAGNGD